MEASFALGIFIILFSALIGGYAARLIRLQPIVGYIIGGVVSGNLISLHNLGVAKLAEVGSILLLFSIGLEFSLNKFSGLFKQILIASAIQIILSVATFTLLLNLVGIDFKPALVISMGFSLSSTAVVLKILTDKAELDAFHGKVMLGWLLVQDLAVVPMMISLPFIASDSGNVVTPLLFAFLKSIVLVVLSLILGKHIVPAILHKVTQTNSRELLLLTSVILATGTAYGVTYLGVSATLGAFLAGLVISESQEHHAVFAETRSLRDLFVAVFFVSLGLLVSLPIVGANILLIIISVITLLLVKIAILLGISLFNGFKGKTAITIAFGLSQVGEFAFVLFATAANLKIISETTSSIIISISLISLIVTPFLFKAVIPFWRRFKYLKPLSSGLSGQDTMQGFKNHIIICGYGRVGGWVGKSLEDHNIPYVVIDYDQSKVNELKSKNIPVIYGDPTESEVMDAANVSFAKAVVVAIPDRFAQESLIAHVQTVAPNAKIISRVHLDEDWNKLKLLQVDKLVQPEFEASAEILRSIFRSLGYDKDSIRASIKNLRVSHSKL